MAFMCYLPVKLIIENMWNRKVAIPLAETVLVSHKYGFVYMSHLNRNVYDKLVAKFFLEATFF